MKKVLLHGLSFIFASHFSFGQNIGVNTDGSSPTELLHVKSTAASQNHLLIQHTLGAQELALRLYNSATASANWKLYVPASSSNLRLYNVADRVTFLSTGQVGINMSPAMMLDVTSATTTAGESTIRGASTGNAAVYGVLGTITSTTATASGVRGSATGNAAVYGVYGDIPATTTTANAAGVRGYSAGGAGNVYGVFGESNATGTSSAGVRGLATNNNGKGIFGQNTSTGTGTQYGVYGQKSGATGTGTGYGVYGTATGTATTNYGGYFTASGGTNNYGLIVPSGGGRIGFGTATPDASALLDVVSSSQGVRLPQVALTATNAAGPVTSPASGLIVYNTATAGTFPANVTPGYYYWSGSQWERFGTNPQPAWYTAGNSNTTVTNNFLGTTDNNPIAIRSNNTERMRITPAGEVIIGGTAPVLPGDLFMASSLSGYEWPINGYGMLNNSAGVYGMIDAGISTAYSGVQGEYYGISTGSAVAGLYSGTGTGFGVMGFRDVNQSGTGYGHDASVNNLTRNAIYGFSNWGNAYCFGVAGYSWNDANRHGGVIGGSSQANPPTQWASLGYRNSAGNHYGVYYTNAQTGAGYLPDRNLIDIGSGGCGGVIGSWTRGEVMGHISSGEMFASYNIGNSYISGYSAEVITVKNKRVAAYTMTSTDIKVYNDGIGKLINGKVRVNFEKSFSELIGENKPVVTITPMGQCNGIYISNIDSRGFDVTELNNGNSNVEFSYILIGKRIDADNKPELPEALAKPDFDEKMKDVMFNENNLEQSATPIWWDGTKVRFDTPPQPKSSEKKKTGYLKPRKFGVKNN